MNILNNAADFERLEICRKVTKNIVYVTIVHSLKQICRTLQELSQFLAFQQITLK